MKKLIQFIMLISFALLTQSNYAQVSLVLNHEIYNPGDNIVLWFNGGPGNSADWIGIYKIGDVPGTTDAILWNYVNNTQTSGEGRSSGKITFMTGLEAEGDYWAALFENDGYTILAADTFKVKDGQTRVSINKSVYDIAEPITAVFKHGPNNATDWIGIYHVGDTPGPIPSTLWYYVNGTQGPTVGITDGSVTFETGLVDKGEYWAGFFENDGYTLLDSIGFTVTNLSDSIPPAAPEITAITGTYYNYITWTEVPGEHNETYSVYVSEKPISDLEADDVELVGMAIPEGAQFFEHILKSANVDRERTYYYAVTCTDLSNNTGPAGTFGPLTNMAKGVTTVSINPPTPFAADGDLSEWEGITPFLMQSALGTANVPANTKVDGDEDLSAEIKIAIDENYLYVMMDITDDAYYHPFSLNSWERDEPDLYIGLYNMKNVHIEYGKGSTPDYQIRFDQDRIRLDGDTDDSLFIPVGENYFHDGGTLKFPSGYFFEARIPLADLETKRQADQTANDTIVWKVGDKIPFTIGINDNDDGASREGILFYSPQPAEKAYYDVSSWTYTWISDEVTDVHDNQAVINVYELRQNYPNPFNPNTRIQYSLAVPGHVSLKVYDVIGNQVAELVSRYQNAGHHNIDFSAAKMNLSSGVYFYKLQAGDFVSLKKMMLIK